MTGSTFGTFPELFLEFLGTSMQQSPDMATGVHRPSFEKFARLGFPTRKHEEWKYTNTKPLQQLPYKLLTEGGDEPDVGLIASLLRDDEINIVFIDGQLSSAYSSLAGLQDGITIKDLQSAYSQHKSEVEALLNQQAGEKDNAFRHLNNAFLKAGVFIKVAKGVKVEEPVHVIHIATGPQKEAEEAPSAFFPRILVSAGPSSELSLIESYAGRGRYLVSAQTDFNVAPNARVRHVRIQNESQEAIHIGQGTALLAADGGLDSMNICVGAKLHRLDFDSVLGGSGCELHVNGFYHTDGERHVDNHTSIDHAFPNSQSSQLYKGIIDGSSRAVFNGKVFVRQDAQQTAAFQLNKNLLLSDEAEVDTKPELQIDADDVKCSHGAAVGQLNQDEIFYLQSRGIKRPDAVSLLSRAFADDVLALSPVKSADERLRSIVHGSLKW